MKLFRSANKSGTSEHKSKSKTKTIYDDQNAPVYSDRSEVGSEDLGMIDAIRNSASDRRYH